MKSPTGSRYESSLRRDNVELELGVLLRLGRLRRFLIRLLVRPLFYFLPFVRDPRLRSEPLVVRVLDDFADLDVAQTELQRVFRACIGGEPVRPVNLLAPGGKFGKQVLFASLPRMDIGYGLAISFHNLKIVVVHPDASLEIALVFLNLLGRNLENVGIRSEERRVG